MIEAWRRFWWVGAAILVLAGLGVDDHAFAQRSRGCGRHCGPRYPYPFGLDITPPVFPLPEPPNGLPPEAYPEGEPQVVPGPSPRPGPAPYPQGFVLDVPIKPDREPADRAQGPTLTRYRDVADALARCWNPPAEFDDRRWQQATLRVSFKRDGSINGTPRIPFVGGDLTGEARSGLTQSLMAALLGCAPLKFSPALGAAVAGQIFALRFIEQDQDPWQTPPKP